MKTPALIALLSRCALTPLRRCLAIGLIALSTGGANADQGDTLNLLAGIGTQRDNNLFRVDDGGESSDVITATTVGLQIDKSWSLQRFKLDARLIDNRYRDASYLDYVGKNFNAAWLWAITPRLRGTISGNYTEQLNSFVDFNGTGRNLRETENYRADLEWEAWGRFRLLAGVSRVDQTNTQRTFDDGDYSANGAETGIKYQMPSGSFLTLMTRKLDGEYENRVINLILQNDSGFKQTENEARFLWVLSGKSRLNGKFGHLKREHDNFTLRDYSGNVGSLEYIWDATGKLRFVAGVQRNLGTSQRLDSSYYIADIISFTPTWQISAKTALRARLSREERDYRGAILSFLPKREETLRQGLIALDWSPLRTLTLSGTLQHESRNSSLPNNDYDATVTGINASLSF
jgi:exopolysaccharide biosynthesis operon protein EpsL